MNLILAAFMLVALVALAYKYRIFPFMATVLASDADIMAREGTSFTYPVYQAVKIYGGAIVMLNSTRYAVPGAVATGQIAVGRAKFQVDNTSGASGALTVEVEQGVFEYVNSGTDPIAQADINNVCYIADDNTVAKTNGGGTLSVAGVIRDVDANGVWVQFGPVVTLGGLAAANNLSDVAAAATARANIAANKVVLNVLVADLTSASALISYVVSPVAGTIKKINSVINGALATGDATLTGKIGATAITNGVVTITQAGSAAGQMNVATPTALNVVAIGDVISLTVGGTNTAAKTAVMSIYIET